MARLNVPIASGVRTPVLNSMKSRSSLNWLPLVLAGGWFVLLGCSPGLPLLAQEPPIVGPAIGVLPGVDPGELLLGELACVSCHAAPDSIKTRLNSRGAPRLGTAGLKLTPQYLRNYLASPGREKPGTTMPDVLGTVDPKQREPAVEELVHFLLANAPKAASGENTGDSSRAATGRELFHTVGCVACHAPELPAGSTAAATLAKLREESVPLPELARKMSVADLTSFLKDPQRFHPSGRMPSLNLTDQQANALAIYLLRKQLPPSQADAAKQRVPGLAYQYFESSQIHQVGDLEHLAPVSEGTTDTLSLPAAHRPENFGYRFTGQLRAPVSGEYAFALISDDGSKLYIDGKEVVDNDGEHAATEVHRSLQLTAGDHELSVLFFNAGGEFGLRVGWQPPGAKREIIPASALFHSELKLTPVDATPFTLDDAKAAGGRDRFTAAGCASCHELNGESPKAPATAKPLLELNPEGGCLADHPPTAAARYSLSPAQVAALRATIRNARALTTPLDARTQAAYVLTRLNCIACHARDDIGGPSPARSPYFTSVGNVDLGDEGRLPPHLNGVGAKLRPDWLRQVLLQNATARPYLATHMPQFGSNQVAQLASLLAQADGLAPTETAVPPADAKYGRKLVGTGGMSCITCHVFAGHKSLGVPAMDLTLMSKRLRAEWFLRYVINPIALRPGTRMPSFWPEGKSTRQDILNGDTARQTQAIWAFLSSPKDLGLPDGLIQGQVELVADKAAVIYRNFVTGSTRSIAVGYPERANLNWDANELRLATIWQGPFLDASRHREGRGEGFVDALGYNVVRFPTGPPLAIFKQPDEKWPTSSGRTAGFRMKGYTLDEQRRPAFHYEFAGIQVEDYPVAKATDTEAYFVRTISFQGAAPEGNLWVRAWAGASAEANPDGTYLLDGKLKMRIPNPPGAPVIRQSAGHSELLIPITLANGAAKLIEEIVW